MSDKRRFIRTVELNNGTLRVDITDAVNIARTRELLGCPETVKEIECKCSIEYVPYDPDGDIESDLFQ